MPNADAALARGIYCLETIWFDPSDQTSLRPMMDWMHFRHGTPYVHRSAVTREEFFRHLEAWMECDSGDEKYSILLLAYHGDVDQILLNDDGECDDAGLWVPDEDSVVTLEEIGVVLEGSCEEKVIHFSSCATVNVNNDQIEDFLSITGASAVSGYLEYVDWMESMAFEMLYMEEIQLARFKYLTTDRMREVNEKLKQDHLRDLRTHLGFNLRVG